MRPYSHMGKHNPCAAKLICGKIRNTNTLIFLVTGYGYAIYRIFGILPWLLSQKIWQSKKMRLSKNLTSQKIYKTFHDRNIFLKRACKYSQSIYVESPSWNHTQRLNFQKKLMDRNHCMTEVEDCIPSLPKFGGIMEHFYNDTFKFSVCLPTKTGSSNWLRG